MKYTMSRLLVLIGLAGAALPAWGHHSTAMFDYSRTETLSGTVKDFQWANPHIYIQLVVPDGNGGTVEWSIEGGTPSGLTRAGWTHESIKAGDKVTVAFAPRRDGAHAGTVKTITFADGKVLKGLAGAPPPTGGDNKGPPAPVLPSLERATPQQP